MAARRLIAILLVLLFLSSLAAALAPVPEREGSSTTSTTTAAESPTLPAAGTTQEPRVIEQAIDFSAKRSIAIRGRVGDRLELKVTSQRAGTIELAGLGPAEDVGPNQPAFFDLILRNGGEFPVRFLGTDREIAAIKVSPPRTEPIAR